MENQGCGHFLLHFYHSFLFTLFPCSSMGSLQWYTVLLNFSNMGPSDREQFFVNCSSTSAPWVIASAREPAHVWAPLQGLQLSSGHLHLLQMGSFTGCSVGICFTIALHGVQENNLLPHGLHRLKGNFFYSAWSISSYYTSPTLFSAGLFPLTFFSHYFLSQLLYSVFCAFFNMWSQICRQLGWWAELWELVHQCWSWLKLAVPDMGAAPGLFSKKPLLQFPPLLKPCQVNEIYLDILTCICKACWKRRSTCFWTRAERDSDLWSARFGLQI